MAPAQGEQIASLPRIQQRIGASTGRTNRVIATNPAANRRQQRANKSRHCHEPRNKSAKPQTNRVIATNPAANQLNHRANKSRHCHESCSKSAKPQGEQIASLPRILQQIGEPQGEQIASLPRIPQQIGASTGQTNRVMIPTANQR